MRDRFYEEVAALPQQIAWKPRSPQTVKASRIVFAGMGGSALAAEMAGAWLRREVPFRVVRRAHLPEDTGKGDTVLCISCSGNTRETLAVWDEARRRGLPRAAVSTGGDLLVAAEREKQPFVRLPGGLSPRSSIGYLVRGCLELVALRESPPWEKLEGHLSNIRAALSSAPEEARVHEWAADTLAVVSTEATALAARRWSADFAENAKLPLWTWEFPEAAHNALMVLAREAPRPAPSLFVLESAVDRQSPHWQEFMSLLRDGGGPLKVVHFPYSDPWIELFGLAYAGDWFSLHYAEKLGVPAGSLSLLDAFKERLRTRLNS